MDARYVLPTLFLTLLGAEFKFWTKDTQAQLVARFSMHHTETNIRKSKKRFKLAAQLGLNLNGDISSLLLLKKVFTNVQRYFFVKKDLSVFLSQSSL